MYDLKEKQAQVKSKLKAIQVANDLKTNAADKLSQFDDTIENLQGQIGSTIDGFTDKVKKKLPNTENLFEKIIQDLDQILPKKNNESLLRTTTRDAVKRTSVLIKPIFLNNIRKLFFANDSDFGCGTQTLMPYSGLTISPKEFDPLDILQTSPFDNLGKLSYEGQQSPSKIKMNRVFYDTFTTSPYNFVSEDETQLFQMNWNASIQKYEITGIDTTTVTVDKFITKYYESIEFPSLTDVVKNTFNFIIPVGDIVSITPGGKSNPAFDSALNKIMKTIDKIAGYCGDTSSDLKQNPTDQFSEREVDVTAFFDFDDVEGIDLDDESRRLNKVLRFTDCNNFDIPMNQKIVEDFAFYASTKNEVEVFKAFDNALNKTAKDAASKNLSIPFPNFLLNLNFNSLKNLPKALLSVIMAPKFFFPLVVLWKMLKEASANAFVSIKTIIKNVSKFLHNTLRDIWNKFLEIFWKLIKPQILIIIKDLIKRITKNSKSRLKTMIIALIDILSMIIPFVGIKSCEDFYNAILQVLNLIRVGVSQKINGLLLQLSKRLPGYSEDRAAANAAQLLEANGIPTGDLFGQENNVMTFVSSILKGHQKEMDENSFVQVSLDYAQIPVAPLGGVAVVPPGVLKAHGKLT
jgi:hypothetical protein